MSSQHPLAPPEGACVLDAHVRHGCDVLQPECAYVWTQALSRQRGAEGMSTSSERVPSWEEHPIVPLSSHEATRACVVLPRHFFAPLSWCLRNTSRGLSDLYRRRSQTIEERVGWSAFDKSAHLYQMRRSSHHAAGDAAPRLPLARRRPSSLPDDVRRISPADPTRPHRGCAPIGQPYARQARCAYA